MYTSTITKDKNKFPSPFRTISKAQLVKPTAKIYEILRIIFYYYIVSLY
jgi:hypothetical protein